MEETQEDAGFEAPRNSLDEASSAERNAHEFEDVAFGHGVCNQASDKRCRNRDARDEKKPRAPNVVARLMGLNAMSELLPTRNSPQNMPKSGADAVAKSRRIPVRDDHPQEAELQRFKHEFAAKQHLDDMKRQLEEKKRKVRVTLDKARLALSQGIIASSPKLGKEFEDSKEFLEALEFLQCNKDFIFQFLQQKPNAVFSNNGSTSPVTTSAKKGKQGIRGRQATQATQAIQAAKVISDSTQRGFSPRSLARLFMHSDSRKGNDHNKLNPKPRAEGCAAQSPTAIHRSSRDSMISDDVKYRAPTSTSSRYMLPSPKSQIHQETKGSTNKKNSARDVIAEIKERLRRRENQPKESTKNLPNSKVREPASSPKTTNFTLTKSLSTGKRISMLRPDFDDNEEISTPEGVLRDYSTDSPSAILRVKGRKTKTTTNSVRASESNQKKPNATPCNHVKGDSPGRQKLMDCAREAASSPANSVKALESSHQKPSATRSSLVKLSDSPGKKPFLYTVNDAASSPHLARCLLVPNAGMLRGNCTNGIDFAQNATTATVPKPARNTQNGSQDGTRNVDKRMLGLFSVGSKKGHKVGHETPATVPIPSSRAAESCVSQRMQSNAGCKDWKDANAKVRRNILDHGKDGQDATRDKEGRDSPVVSVLDPPCQEFKDITNAHQGPLRIRLRRPKWEGRSERVRDDESDETREKHRDSRRSSEVPPQCSPPQTISHANRPSPSPASPASDFAFVRDILVSSGFHTHGGRNITHWYSSTQPISPQLLKKMQITSRTTSARSSHHRILFDAINEILITKLELSSAAATPANHCFGLAMVAAAAPGNAAVAAVSGRRFVEEVWSEIRKRGSVATTSREETGNELFHSLVAQEVQPTKSWMLLRRDVDRICLQVEKVVWEELVEEVCCGLLLSVK